MKILENVLISTLTTMRIGGVAKYVIEIETPEDIPEAYSFALEHNLPTFILGGGANTIGHDEGYDGAILLNKIKGIRIVDEDDTSMTITGMGGEVWDDFVEYATEKNLSGIEALSSIPGTLGAAPVQNIGAYGQDVSQTLVSVEAYDSLIDEFVTIPKDKMEMGYRKTIFNSGETKGRYFIYAVTVKLAKNKTLTPPFYTSLQKYVDDNNITDFSPKNIRKMVAEIRAGKLPDPKEFASAGSFFKNVYVDDAEADRAEKNGIKVWRDGTCNKINSGWLIENAGLSGKEFYGMEVSDKASLVLINKNAKGYDDLDKARKEIRKVIKEKYGYELEQEPVEII